MKTISASLTHVVRPPRPEGDGPHPALVMLHGRGADEHDLLGLAPHLDPRLLVVSVRAPFPFTYGGGFAWYDVIEVGTPQPQMFDESRQRLETFLDEAAAGYPVDAGRVFLLGFSMGAVMAHTLALTQPDRIAGVIAHSGYAPPVEALRLRVDRDRLRGRGWFVAHGAQDPVIPVGFGRAARDFLREAGADVIYREYPIAHHVSQESLNDLSAWLTGRLDSHPPA